MEKNMAKKTYIIGIAGLLVILAIGVGAYYVFFKPSLAATTLPTGTTVAQQQGQPVRVAELKGFVKSIEGNEIVIINEISEGEELTDEEKAAKKAERAKLSIEERQALKAEESATLQKEDVRIIIPVGVTIKKTTGDATGTLVDGGLDEIKEGTYISIWVIDYKATNQTVEFVKIRGSV